MGLVEVFGGEPGGEEVGDFDVVCVGHGEVRVAAYSHFGEVHNLNIAAYIV